MATAHPAARNLCVAATCTTAIRHRGGKGVGRGLGGGKAGSRDGPPREGAGTECVGDLGRLECLYSTLNAPLVRSVRWPVVCVECVENTTAVPRFCTTFLASSVLLLYYALGYLWLSPSLSHYGFSEARAEDGDN